MVYNRLLAAVHFKAASGSKHHSRNIKRGWLVDWDSDGDGDG